MTTDAADRFAFEDFTGTITCDWTSPEIELEMVFDDRLRTAWRELTVRDVELREVEPRSPESARGIQRDQHPHHPGRARSRAERSNEPLHTRAALVPHARRTHAVRDASRISSCPSSSSCAKLAPRGGRPMEPSQSSHEPPRMVGARLSELFVRVTTRRRAPCRSSWPNTTPAGVLIGCSLRPTGSGTA
jgi:hypothetical protein